MLSRSMDGSRLGDATAPPSSARSCRETTASGCWHRPDVARVVTSSVADVSAVAAIDRAQAELRPGDVLLIELHAIGPRGRFPMEFWDDVFDAIKIATARGVVVIEAAGNGAEDPDHEACKGQARSPRP